MEATWSERDWYRLSSADTAGVERVVRVVVDRVAGRVAAGRIGAADFGGALVARSVRRVVVSGGALGLVRGAGPFVGFDIAVRVGRDGWLGSASAIAGSFLGGSGTFAFSSCAAFRLRDGCLSVDDMVGTARGPRWSSEEWRRGRRDMLRDELQTTSKRP